MVYFAYLVHVSSDVPGSVCQALQRALAGAGAAKRPSEYAVKLPPTLFPLVHWGRGPFQNLSEGAADVHMSMGRCWTEKETLLFQSLIPPFAGEGRLMPALRALTHGGPVSCMVCWLSWQHRKVVDFTLKSGFWFFFLNTGSTGNIGLCFCEQQLAGAFGRTLCCRSSRCALSSPSWAWSCCRLSLGIICGDFCALVMISPCGQIQGVRTQTCQRCSFFRRIYTRMRLMVSKVKLDFQTLKEIM